MIHYRQRFSLLYWLYSIATALAVSRLGTWFFASTKSKMIGRYSGKWEKMWWRMYMINFIYHSDEKDLIPTEGEPINVRWMQEYDFSHWNVFFEMSVLSHVAFEVSNGRKPFVADILGIWKDFFEQPVTDSIEQNNVPVNAIKGTFFTSKFTPYNSLVTKLWCKLFRVYVIFNADVSAYMNDEVNTVLKCPEKTLGIICRGTDYVSLKPKNHPVQPNVEDVIKNAKKWVKKYGYTKIYLATEEKAIFDKFENNFPGMMLANKREYYDIAAENCTIMDIDAVHFDRENDDYLKGLEYMSSLNILSKCDALLGGNCGGSTMATFMNDGKYTRTKIFDRGIYR